MRPSGIERQWRMAALVSCYGLCAIVAAGFSIRYWLEGDGMLAAIIAGAVPFAVFSATIEARRKPHPRWVHMPTTLYGVAMFYVLTFHLQMEGGAVLMWYTACPPMAILILGSTFGLVISGVAFAMLVTALGMNIHALPFEYGLHLCIAFLIIASLVYIYEYQREAAAHLLQDAHHRIKDLEGMLSICGWCHKQMRDHTGDWVTTERYFEDRAPVHFSHGICPDCATRVTNQAGDVPPRPAEGL